MIDNDMAAVPDRPRRPPPPGQTRADPGREAQVDPGRVGFSRFSRMKPTPSAFRRLKARVEEGGGVQTEAAEAAEAGRAGRQTGNWMRKRRISTGERDPRRQLADDDGLQRPCV